jgi:hypothetical protein
VSHSPFPIVARPQYALLYPDLVALRFSLFILEALELTMTLRAASTMILRDLSACNMGRGAYDTTGVKKPGAPPPPPK